MVAQNVEDCGNVRFDCCTTWINWYWLHKPLSSCLGKAVQRRRQTLCLIIASVVRLSLSGQPVKPRMTVSQRLLGDLYMTLDCLLTHSGHLLLLFSPYY